MSYDPLATTRTSSTEVNDISFPAAKPEGNVTKLTYPSREIISTSVDTVEELFLTNTFSHIFLTQAALPHMTKGSVIVGISGIIAEQNLPGMATYGASKAAVRSFNEALSREARRLGIRVIDARPPHTETGLATRAIAGIAPKFPHGLTPVSVAQRIVLAIASGEDDLPSTAFSN